MAAKASHSLPTKQYSTSGKRRPLNAYIRFCQDERPKVVTTFPELSMLKITEVMGQKWRLLSDQQKQVYISQYKEEVQALSPTDLEILKQERHKKMKKRKEQKLKKFMEESNRPKKPPSAFLLYANTLDKGEAPNTVFVKGASLRWYQLPMEDRQIYQEAVARLRAKYLVEIDKWYSKMIAMDKPELVPLESLARHLKMPVHPGANALTLFIKQRSKHSHGEKTRSDIIREWKELSESQRANMKQKYKKEVSKYKQDFRMWKRDMKSQGPEKCVKVLLRSLHQKAKKKSKAPGRPEHTMSASDSSSSSSSSDSEPETEQRNK